ncbi:hypothetical protein [Paraburkholderia bryophila]|uniref:hypothetical protein n=1 Tax=Paraburkholderia bryophila TaxID=420952 RepID=UPI0011BF2781|nr:hypothetical protein [Paraburkholderia bryophila]
MKWHFFGFGSDPTGAGAGGFTGIFNGPAAYCDTGLTRRLHRMARGCDAMSGNLGDALGSAPTWLFGGLLPGGGMTGTSSGALGGLSGAVNGDAPIGGATMGGFNPAPWALGRRTPWRRPARSEGKSSANDGRRPGGAFRFWESGSEVCAASYSDAVHAIWHNASHHMTDANIDALPDDRPKIGGALSVSTGEKQRVGLFPA